LDILKQYKLDKNIENILQELFYNKITCLEANTEIKKQIEIAQKSNTNSLWTKIKKKETLNNSKMTMIDPINMQKNLRIMKTNNCEVVIVEVSSQGLQQKRHFGLGKFDYAGFLNLYPEHIESHGSFENYKMAKAKLFQNLKDKGTAIVNANDKYANEMLKFCPKQSKKIKVQEEIDYKIDKYSTNMFKAFEVKMNHKQFAKIHSSLIADFEVENLVFAKTIAEEILSKRNMEVKRLVLEGNFWQIPGRMEWVVLNNQIQ
jgi:UDP-N-acetylmuramyl tripeptide synthase